MRNNKLTIIAPCYNEQDIIGYSIEQLTMLLNLLIDDNLISNDSKICFINDGLNNIYVKIATARVAKICAI